MTNEAIIELPKFSDEIYENLPDFFKDCVKPFNNDPAKDVFLIGLITLASAILPNYYGYYFGKKYECNLKSFVVANAGEGKGISKWVYLLGQGIDDYLKETNTKNSDKSEYNMFYLPVNISMPGMFTLLAQNNERGFLFSSEADTMVNIFETDFGDYSTLERQSFEHEGCDYFRKGTNGNREYINLKYIRLSTFLNGTKQVALKFISSIENGLLSRYMWYLFDNDTPFVNPFDVHSNGLTEYFIEHSKKLLNIYKMLTETSICFEFEKNHQKIFFEHFKEIEASSKILYGREIKASIRRLAVQTYRIAMILTFFRNMDYKINNSLACMQVDFDNAISISDVLLKHAEKIFSSLPKTSKDTLKNTDNRNVAIWLKNNTKLEYSEINKICSLTYTKSWYTNQKIK